MAEGYLAGIARMQAFLAEFPDHLLNGFREGSEHARLLSGSRPRPVFSVGMGGSGISADFARVLVERETKLPFTTLRSPRLPAVADRDALVVLMSHSGKTWEVLEAYDDARRRGCRMVAIASGGDLAERADRDGVPLILIDPDMPPRSSVGLALGALLGLLDTAFPESNEARLMRIAEGLREANPRLVRADGAAGAFARRLGNRMPFLYAEAALLPLARRWANQIEENAKRLAVYDEAPEFFHNALVGWEALVRSEGRQRAAITLRWGQTPGTVRASLDYFERKLRARGVLPLTKDLETDDLLGALLGGIQFGDHLSLHLCRLARRDPVPVDAIARFKEFLAAGPHRPGRGRRAVPAQDDK
ncbi:MAG: SIS domain-containing protein [Thermoplasmata archaeon]